MNYEQIIQALDELKASGGDIHSIVSYASTLASTGKTPLGLNQWQSSDKPVMKDFNEDNRIIDDNLSRLWSQKSNRNLLMNWYFPRPVNQRRVSGTITATGYFIDMWRLRSGSVTLNGNGLVLNGTIAQTLEFPAGGNLLADVRMYSGTASASYNSATREFIITSTGGTVEGAKLEAGTISTLAADPPPDYGTELARCQRYQLYLNTVIVRASRIQLNDIFFLLPLPCSMRVNPVISGDIDVHNMNNVKQNGFAVSARIVTHAGLAIAMEKSAHGLTDAYLRIPGGTVIDANL